MVEKALEINVFSNVVSSAFELFSQLLFGIDGLVYARWKVTSAVATSKRRAPATRLPVSWTGKKTAE